MTFEKAFWIFLGTSTNSRATFTLLARMTRAFTGEHRYPEFPIRFSDAACGQRTPAPTLGQHNEEVLTGLLGVSPEELTALRQAGIIGSQPRRG